MKKVLALILAIVMLFCVCGCNNQPTDTESTTTAVTTTRPTYGGGVPGLAPNTATTTVADTDKNDSTTKPVGGTTATPQKVTTTTAQKVTTTTDQKVTTTTSPQTVPLNKTYTFDVPVLPGDKTKQKLMVNPNRGFRTENYMSVENGKYTPDMYDANGNYKGEKNSAGTAIGWMMKFYNDYEYEAPQVVQTYFYLTQYRDKDLDQAAFDNMNAYFDACRKMNVTIALRFAYVFNYERRDDQDCVSLDQMMRHMQQLKPILAKNRDVLFCLEGGFFGEWGEQSGGSTWWEKGLGGKIMDAAVKMVPDDLWVVVRYYNVWAQTSAETKKQLGFHNDYICGFSHGWDTGGAWTTENYLHAKILSSSVLFEGEMPWGGQLPNNMKNLNGWNVVKYLYDNHYTVLSCYHNNREGGVTYDMKKWRSVAVTPQLLDQYGLRYYNEWFKTADGKNISRSLFDYLQHFLGYHFVSSDVTVKKAGTKADVSFSLTNYGFAAPLALKEVKLVLLDKNNKVVDSKKLCELVDLQGGSTKKFNVSLTLPNASEVYKVGLWFENHNNVGARLANDIEMVGQINLLGVLD